MQVFKDLNTIKQFQNSVITIGTFDGVHIGHREIIHKIISAAKDIHGESVIVTFYPHPRQIIEPTKPIFNLNTLNEKLELLQTLGVDNVIVVPFSREFSEMEAEDYAENFLIKKFNPKIIVFGYDHKFGRDRKGDIHLLKSIASKYKIQVEEISAQTINNLKISSTKIRSFLSEGKVDEANALLGYHYTLSGLVIKGDQIGRTLGFPTANMHFDDSTKLIPADGVYVVKVFLKNIEGDLYGLLSIGNRPTFNKTEKRIEVYILNFDKTIYGEEIKIEFLHFIRPDKKFNSAYELILAMNTDKKFAEDFIISNKS
ncbi:MAG: bifunctional riboflavin kinase/FAD synthetase [Fimbriimonadaceae bacterium]|nr:bifunctional riboflavin kinase/FAD synthetase [Chitinophagales bacterium]